jgi:hypothetical protein
VSGVLRELADLLRAEQGLIAGAVRDEPAGDPLPAGPRAEAALLLEAIREGYELHYGRSRVLSDAIDEDLALLAGDRLYALGLERLAALGDLDAVRALADVISDSARAHAEGRPERVAAAWQAGLTSVHRAGMPEPGARPR